MKNVLTDMENGQIVTTARATTLGRVDNTRHPLPHSRRLPRIGDKQAERLSFTFNAITGETMPSGTPFRQVALLNQEIGSLFEYRRGEAGIFLNWVLPFLVK